jgi:hypothetical protein
LAGTFFFVRSLGWTIQFDDLHNASAPVAGWTTQTVYDHGHIILITTTRFGLIKLQMKRSKPLKGLLLWLGGHGHAMVSQVGVAGLCGGQARGCNALPSFVSG